MEEKPRQLLPLRTTATRLGVKTKSLRVAAEQGRLPSVRVGEDFLFNLESVQRVLTEMANAAAEKGTVSDGK